MATAAQTAAANDPTAFYASHNWHPIFAEGVKTWMLEVWEQLGGRQPSACFVPTGGGSALVGAWRGIQALPGDPARLIAAQPSRLRADRRRDRTRTRNRAGDARRVDRRGDAIGAPSRSAPDHVAPSVKPTERRACVSEEEIVDALRELWGQGLYVEPTAAVGAAAFRQMVLTATVPDGEIVVLLTGSGLKATETIGKLLEAEN